MTAFDFSGNEGEAANIENPGASGAREGLSLPSRFALRAILPNPAAGGLSVTFDLPNDSHVTLRIFDATGRIVAALVDGHVQAGTHTVAWAGTSAGGREPAIGLYFCRMDAGDFTATRKIVIAR